MQLRQIRVSDTVTRYFVDGDLGAYRQVFLVRPEDGTVIAGWSAFTTSITVEATWISSFDNLVLTEEGPAVDVVS